MAEEVTVTVSSGDTLAVQADGASELAAALGASDGLYEATQTNGETVFINPAQVATVMARRARTTLAGAEVERA